MTGLAPAHNTNANIVGTAEFCFCEGVTTAAAARAAGYVDFKNIEAALPKPTFERMAHFGSYRGLKQKDLTLVTAADLIYTLTGDEWNQEVMKTVFGATVGSAFTQSSMTATDCDALAFSSGTPSTADRWYDLTVSGARIRHLTAIAVTGKVDGTDFETDLKLGRIRFITAQTASVTPKATGPAITSTSAKSFIPLTPFANPTRTGFGRLVIFDQDDDNNVVWDHVDFSCEVTAEVSGKFDGKSWPEIALQVAVTSTLGTLWTRYGMQ